MLPSSLALVRQAFADPAARARAVAVWSSGGAAAIAAGPVLGGILTSTAGWRPIFFVNLPVGAAVLDCWRFARHGRPGWPHRSTRSAR